MLDNSETRNGDLRVAIIGYGLAGSVFHGPLITATDGLTVSAIVTRDESRSAATNRAFPSATVLSTPEALWKNRDKYDVVVIASANRTHCPLGLAAIAAGIPVVIDKPLAVSLSDAETLVAESETRGVPLTVFQNRRWDGDFLTMRTILAEKLLGPLARFESRFERYRPSPRPGVWRERPDLEEGGGLLLDLGSHLIDQAVVLFGAPERVYAEVSCRRPGAQVDDDTFLSLHFAGGFQAHLWMNVLARVVGPRFYASGMLGSYLKYGLDPQESALRDGGRPGDPDWGRENDSSWGRLLTEINGLHVDGSVETLPGQYEQFYTILARSLLQGGPLPVDPRDALVTMRVIEAARLSAREGQVVDLARLHSES